MPVDATRVRRISRQLKADLDGDPTLRELWRKNPWRVLYDRGLTAEEMAEGHELGGTCTGDPTYSSLTH